MSKVIRIICDALDNATPHDDQFIKDVKWDIDSDGRVDLVSTPDRAEAIQFDTPHDAFAFWRTQSHIRPLRPDGEANRPLTAWTVSVE